MGGHGFVKTFDGPSDETTRRALADFVPALFVQVQQNHCGDRAEGEAERASEESAQMAIVPPQSRGDKEASKAPAREEAAERNRRVREGKESKTAERPVDLEPDAELPGKGGTETEAQGYGGQAPELAREAEPHSQENSRHDMSQQQHVAPHLRIV